MPPKRKKAKKPTARQKQSQTVIVNVGGKSKSGRGKLPPPSYQNNLTRIQPQQQIDYTPLLLSMMQQQSKVPIQANPTPPINNIVPPILQPPGGLAEAGQTASNFQPMPSQADDRFITDKPDNLSRSESEETVVGMPPPTKSPMRDLPYEPGGGGGGAPIVTPSSARPTLAESRAEDTSMENTPEYKAIARLTYKQMQPIARELGLPQHKPREVELYRLNIVKKQLELKKK